jgi:MFS transporter, DHA2 family, metal-tetracycline-proton antiporter
MRSPHLAWINLFLSVVLAHGTGDRDVPEASNGCRTCTDGHCYTRVNPAPLDVRIVVQRRSREAGEICVSAPAREDPLTPGQQSGPSEVLIVALVSACTFTSVLSTTMFNVVLPEIGRDFNVTPATLGWLFTAYSLVFAIATTFYGRLGDLYGIRRFLTIGISIFSLGSALAAVALSFELLLAARIFQATGAAAIPALGTATIFRMVPARRRGSAMGYMSAVIGTGAGLGPVIGGMLAEFLSWRALFLVPGLLFLMIPVLLKLLPPMEGRGTGKLDVFGGALVALSLGGLLMAVTNLERAGFMSPIVIGPFIVFILVMAALIRRIRTREDSFVPRTLLANRNFVLLGMSAVGMTATAMGSMVTLPLLLDSVQGVPVGQIGLVMLPSAIASAVLGPVGGRLADRFGSEVPLRIGLASLVVGAFMMSSFGTSGSATTVAIMGICFGMGMGMAGAPLLNSVSLILPQSQGSTGIGLIHMVFLMGGSFGVAVKTAIIDARIDATDGFNPLHSGDGAGFSDAFLVVMVASSLSLFIVSRLLRVPKPGDLVEEEPTSPEQTQRSLTSPRT